MALKAPDWVELRERLRQFEQADNALRMVARRLATTEEDRIKAVRAALALAAKRDLAPLPKLLDDKSADRAPASQTEHLRDAEIVHSHRLASSCLLGIRTWLAVRGVVVVPDRLGLRKSDPLLAQAFDKVRGDKMSYVAAVGCELGPDLEGLPDEAFEDEWFSSLGHFQTVECAQRWLQAGGVLLSGHVPRPVANALRSLRQAYALGHAEATLAFCRTVAEVTAHSWLLSTRRLGRREDPRSPWWGGPEGDAARLRAVRHDLVPRIADVEAVRKKANQILHESSSAS